MTKDGILGLLCLVFLVAELMTNFSSPMIHWLSGMVALTAFLGGE